MSELCGTNDEKRIGTRKKIRKRKLGFPRLKLNGVQGIKRDRNNNNNPRHTTVSNSVELSIRFLAPCFYANICEILEGPGLRRDKRLWAKTMAIIEKTYRGENLSVFWNNYYGVKICIYIYIYTCNNLSRSSALLSLYAKVRKIHLIWHWNNSRFFFQ